MVAPRERPEVLPGTTYKLKTGCGNIYVIINDHEGKPFEVFSVIENYRCFCQVTLN